VNVVAATLAVAVVVGGCSSSSSTSQCSGGSTSTLTVTVVDDSNESADICSATVTASGPTHVTFERTGNTTSCSYLGTVQAGTYEVTATAPTYVTNGNTNIVIQSGCSVQTSIEMTPAPP
jgi:hypothetical protein